MVSKIEPSILANEIMLGSNGERERGGGVAPVL